MEDASNLSDIENVKGKEKFTQSGDKLTWQAGGKDIYYQGTATDPTTQNILNKTIEGLDKKLENL